MADEYIELEVVTEEATLADQAVQKLQLSWPGWEPSEGDLEMVLLETVASMAADAAVTAAAVPAEIFFAFGEQMMGVAVNLGAYATTTLEFTLLDTAAEDGMTIPEGTEVDVDGFIFETVLSVTSPPGASTVEVSAVATELGLAFSGLDGSSVSMVTSLTGIESVAILEPTSGGADPEDTEAYLDRLSQALQLRGITLVVERDYELMALTEAGVAKVTATHMGAREVRVVGIDAFGNDLSLATKESLAALYAQYRMVNTTVTIEDPVRTEVDVTYEAVVYPSHDPASVEAAIDTRLAELLSPANWGSPTSGQAGSASESGLRWYNEPRVRVNKLIDEIGNVPGVNYVVTVDLGAEAVTPVDFEDQFDLGPAGETIWWNKQTAAGALTYVEDVVYAPRVKAMRNRLAPGMDDPATLDQRSELTGHHIAAEGVEKWFRLPVRINEYSIVTGKWGLIWQQHIGAGSPPIALFMREAAPLQFRLANGITDENHWLKTISEDTWYDVVIGVLFSTTTSGWIEVWLDGVQQTLEGGTTHRVTRTATTSAGDYAIQNYDKLGLYTADLAGAEVRDVYHGLYAVGPSRASVMGTTEASVATEPNGDLILPGDVPLPEPGTILGDGDVTDNTLMPDLPAFETNTLADQLVVALWPWINDDLEAYGRALMAMFEEVEVLAFEVDEFEGWTLVLDPTRARAQDLDWLAQFVGEVLPTGLDEALAREWLTDQPNSRRGTLESIVRTAQRTLTDSRTVVVHEREPDEDTVLVQTIESETPDADVVYANLRRDAVPADVVLNHVMIAGQTHADVETNHATYTALKNAYVDYNAMRADMPTGTSYT